MVTFLKSLLKNKYKLAGVIIILLIAGYFSYQKWFLPSAPTRYVTAQATKQTIIVSISGTGQVSQDHTVNILPQSSGKLTSVNAKQGDKVKAGQTIAIVDQSNNSISLNQAKASLASAQANLNSVMAGATSQDIQLAQLALQADEQAVQTASTSLQTTKQKDALAVSTALSNLLNSSLQAVPGNSNLGTGNLTITGNYTSTEQGTYNVKIFNSGIGQQIYYTGLEIGNVTLSNAAPVALGTRGLFIQLTGKAIDNDSWTISIPNISAANYVSSMNAYQTALNNQAADLISGQNAITSAQNKLEQDKINLQVKQQPPTDQQIQSAQASLTSAQAQLQNAEINYNNNILKAPFDGTIAQLNSQVGDQVTGSTVVAIIVNSQSQAIIPLNEVDVSKVKVGDKASMTFDAIDGLTLTGTVVQIDNIGTVSQGVVNYNVKVAFDVEDPSIKPGMSVNVSIITDTQADTLSVPSSAIKTQGNTSYVQILDPKKTQSNSGQTGVTSSAEPTRATVQVGITDGTNTQILSGLSEGDTVVTQTITSSKTTSSATTGTSVLGGLGGGGGTFRATTGGAGPSGATRPGN